MDKILTKTIKPFSTSGHVILPKKFIGKQARIIIENDTDKEKEKGGKNDWENNQK
ncbi:DUF2080 family transposase-associated protein [Methanothermococcus sp.]|uniref:DUF2080 family transposase-associated protein n=1 Tax=Methanothermococcus sp. TaxID=2614238 RepID=UPI0025EF84C3|nr:DUF2080 family transposase-associated protein [Methanothermococcus sp.]